MTNDAPRPKIYPLAWLALAIVAMISLHFAWPVMKWISSPYRWTGLIPLLSGMLMVLISGSAFLRAKTGLLPFSEATSLVTGGFYRFTRNPMYLGMTLFLLGLAILLGTLSPFLPIVLFAIIIDIRFIRNEEKFLIAAFGDEYLDYRKRVRRWL